MQQIRIRRGRRRPALISMVAALVLQAWPAQAGPVGAFTFTALAASSPCNAGGPDRNAPPITLPDGFQASVVASEADPDYDDLADMNVLNETGPRAGQILFHTHEVRDSGSVTATDLATGDTTRIAMEQHWERLDGLAWTPWGTLLFGEEVRAGRAGALLDPNAPHAQGGLLYEYDPGTGQAQVRPAVGSRAHEGLAFDAAGNLYGVSEVGIGQGGAAIFKFVPDRRGDLGSGQLFALKVVSGRTDKTGDALWIPLDRRASEVNSDAAANSAGATRWMKAEDLEVFAETLYVAVSDEHRVIAIDLRQQVNQEGLPTASVWDYVKAGVNAPNTTPNVFNGPDNLAFDPMGHLYIAEDPGGRAPTKTRGNDVWVAAPSNGRPGQPAATVERFASLTDCNAEPSGIYFDRGGHTLYLNIMHRGGSGTDGWQLNLPDQTLAITPAG